MRRLFFLLFASMFLGLANGVWADDLNPDFNAAKNLIDNWFAAMVDQQVDKASAYMAPEFISIHADGVVRNRDQELALIKNQAMKLYHLTDFKFVQSGIIMTVIYKDQVIEKNDKKLVARKNTGRMVVLKRFYDKWLIVAYADLDQVL